MPVPITGSDFLERVRKSGLVADRIVEECVRTLEAEGAPDPSPREIAARLIRDCHLTYFQSGMLLQGKSKGFRLGNYQVLEQLGSGGMGTVYLCHHALLKKCVAIKVLPKDRSRESVSRQRFEREAQAVAGMDHPNIVRAHDLCRQGPLHYLVMEFVEGESLTSLVRQKGPLPIEQACHIIRQAALGLQHAGEKGLIHRDIKPDNLLINSSGLVKILDMGLVLFTDRSDDEWTARAEQGSVMGTADYLAPEQAIDSRSVDVRADIYSLGATFYFALTGQTLFGEGTVAQKLLWHQMRAVRPVREIRPDVPAELESIVMKMVSKKPEDRFSMPEEVESALAPWTQGPVPASGALPTQQLSPLALALLGSEPRDTPQPQAMVDTIVASREELEKSTRTDASIAWPIGLWQPAALLPWFILGTLILLLVGVIALLIVLLQSK
jgi:serine/threonine protein kinase